MKYSTKNDIEVCIQILKNCLDNLPEGYAKDKLKGSINRMIMDLEDFKSIFNGDNK